MSAAKTCKNVYSVPAGVALAPALAKHLLQQYGHTPEALSAIRILLPTRRACRALREAFLQQNNGAPLLLPHMHPVGDIEEDELALSFFDESIAHLPPALSPLRRQILLARLILKLPGYENSPVRSMALAQALGRFIDQIVIEGLDISRLQSLVPQDFAAHWQITLEFLKILTEEWPKIIEEQGVIESAARRDLLIRRLAVQWQDHPPQTPVIAAGTTGSIPATSALLEVIAGLPQGQVLLPGLDLSLDEESWDALSPDHPQYGLKMLLGHLGCAREDVQLWPHSLTPQIKARQELAGEMMRPAATAAKWQDLSTNATAQQNLRLACEGLRLVETENEGEEAHVIALAMREALETPERTAALITPDRRLAKRVAHACRRWGITLDDSAGTPLDATRVGTFLSLAHEAVQENVAPVPLLALLKHDLCSLKHINAPLRKTIDTLEIKALRGLRPKPGFSGILQRLEGLADTGPQELILKLEKVMQPYMAMAAGDATHTLGAWLTAHIGLAEQLAEGAHERGAERLWSGDEGEGCALFLADLQTQAHMMPPLTAAQYGEVLTQLMHAVMVRPSYGTHPRLMILGQLEARLVQADLVILSGLNEGTWPADPGHDPWMSRPMRQEFGLPALERAIGLSAHDFQQAFCAPDVLLTRANRVEGAPAVPSRWLQRLQAVLQAAKIALPETPYLAWAHAQDSPETVTPLQRPAPRPPAALRPKEISVTRVETWLQDPYSIYARYILRLKKLDAIDKAPDAAERGSLLHKILERFVAACPQQIPPDAEDILLKIAREELQQKFDDPAIWRLWWPRLARMAGWLAKHEKDWRAKALPLKLEAEGRMEINPSFTLTGKADRIDKTHDGKAAIIDYKSGGTYRPGDITSGKLPQLPLEAAMLAAGAFDGVPALESETLAYWKLTGGRTPGEEIIVQQNIAALAEQTRDLLQNLAAIFAQETTPYYSLPRPDNAPRFQDYEHLARVREWAVLSDDAGEAA